jgi:hypothetical protein
MTFKVKLRVTVEVSIAFTHLHEHYVKHQQNTQYYIKFIVLNMSPILHIKHYVISKAYPAFTDS